MLAREEIPRNKAPSLLNSTTTGATGQAKTLYCGGNGGPVKLANTGTVTGSSPGGGGWAWGVEDDKGDAITIDNSGSISHDTGLGMFVYGTVSGTATITNESTGSIFGGNEGIAAESYIGNITVEVYGSVSAGSTSGNAIHLGSGNDTVRLHGLPTIVGTMNGSAGNNVLEFDVTGTLDTVNGATANKGSSLSAYGLGTSGTLTVSGKQYKWANFNVTGTVTP